MADSLADIEAALAVNRTPELLAVYADALQAIGDPRGELIALDLHAPSDEIAARKRELIDRWLGAELAARVLDIGKVDHGFVDIPWGLAADEVERMLAHPALFGALRTFAFEDTDRGMRRAVELLCATPPPWLEHLHVVRYRDDPSTDNPFAIDDEQARALVTATPRLRRLTLAGAGVFDELVHPGVQSLCLYNYNALGALLRDGVPLALTELDLQLSDTPADDVLATMLPLARLPVLRRLDLARNETLWRDPAFALVAANPIMRQLAWLRVPSVRSDAHLDVVERATAASEIEIIVARAYENHRPRRTPATRIRMPPVRPWPPSDLRPYRFSIAIPGHRHSIDFEVPEAVKLMEARFDLLAEPERATWIALWRGLHALAPDASFELPAPALEAALAAVGATGEHRSVTALRTALAARTGDAVQVRHWSLWA